MTNEEAIKLLDNLVGMVEDNHDADYDTALYMAIKALEQQQRTGHWIENDIQDHVEIIYHCDKCGNEAWGEYEKTPFCPNCGARMESEDKE